MAKAAPDDDHWAPHQRVTTPPAATIELPRAAAWSGAWARSSPRGAVLAQQLAESQAEFVGEYAVTVYGDIIVELGRTDGFDSGTFRVIVDIYTGDRAGT